MRMARGMDDNATENEHVAYRLNVNVNGSVLDPPDNVLRKYMDGQWYPVATNIGALNFAYLDEDGVAILNPSANLLGSIRVVRIQAVAVPSPLRAGLGTGIGPWPRACCAGIWENRRSYNARRANPKLS